MGGDGIGWGSTRSGTINVFLMTSVFFVAVPLKDGGGALILLLLCVVVTYASTERCFFSPGVRSSSESELTLFEASALLWFRPDH